jgi:glycosyltransferase involved in cell wall biosynthesis
MRILLVKSFPRLSSLKPLAKELKNRGHDINILVPHENPDCTEMRVLGIPTYSMDFVSAALVDNHALGRVSAHKGGIKRLIEFLRQHSFDIINLNLYYARLYGRIASLFVNNGIVISTIRGHESHYERWTNWIDNTTVAVSASVKRFLIKRGLPENNIVVIHNGIDIETTFTVNSNRYYLHKELGLNQDIKLIGMVAFFRGHQLKGHKIFLDAAKEVSNKYINVKFIMVGSDIDRAGNKQYCEKYAQRLFIEDKVYFLGERYDVNSIMDSLYVHVLPSLSEGCPMVLLEAMARGVPNIASRLDSIIEIIEDGKNGILFIPGDYRALADAISFAIDDPDKIRDVSTAGRKTVENGFNAQLMTDRYEALFKKKLYGS